MSVCLGMLTVELHIPDSHSLKERRSVVNSLKEKIRKRCNVSIADLSPDNLWQRVELCFSAAGETQSNVDTAFRNTIEIMDNEMRCELLNSRIEYYA